MGKLFSGNHLNLTFLAGVPIYVHNFIRRSDHHPSRRNPSLAPQPVVGLWTQRRHRTDSIHLINPDVIGYNILTVRGA